jgi:methylenetetrahydrofolate reductase (NADPH)
MNEASAPRLTSFAERLRAGRFAITAEIAPPVSCDADDLRRKAAPLQGLADAVNVTDGAGARASMSALAAAAILIGMGIEPILQLACRDKNRIALQGELMGAAALGIRNLLLLTGDDPKAGDQPDTKPVFDIDSKALLETARRLRDEGTLPTGRKVGGKADFFLGAADVPIDPPAGWQPKALLGKVASGAQFVQTQFCMDAAIVRRYVGALAAAGLTQQLSILIGITPLRSAKSAAWMKSHLFGTIIPDALIKRMEDAADPAREGVRICAGYIEELRTIPGVGGVHIMAPGNDAAIAQVIAAVRAQIK